ncbi:MAG: DNA replication protein DnaC, partial [Christensenellaceae bacterium]|nr:DNA replication protein DnaC [Christensenellaceae bacterium]
ISTELIFEADALFIDDLGTEPMTANVTREYLFELLTERETSGKLTAIACNLTLQQVKERYTEKTASRLFSQANGSVLRLEGKDIRL